MILLRVETSRLASAFVLQKPIKVPLTYWYKYDASLCVAVQNDKGIINIDIPITSRAGLEKGLVATESEIQNIFPPGTNGIFDDKTGCAVYHSVKGWTPSSTSWYPDLSIQSTVLLAGDFDGRSLTMYTASRNTNLSLFAQTRTYNLYGDEQTEFGRDVAARLVIRRAGLHPMDDPSNVATAPFEHTYKRNALPVECYNRLLSLTTTEEKKEQPALPSPVEEENKDEDRLDLSLVVELGLYDKDVALPVKLFYKEYLRNCMFSQKEIDSIEEVIITDEDSMTIKGKDMSSSLMEDLPSVLPGWKLWIVQPGMTSLLPVCNF
jgi:hypothetical protein